MSGAGASPGGPLLSSAKKRSGEDGIAALLADLLSTNPRASDARAIAGGKLKDRALLLENPVRKRDGPPASASAGHGRGRARPAAALATRREQRDAGLYNLKGQGLSFEMVRPLHQHWQRYVQGLIVPAQTLKECQALLLAADLHGCLLRVAEAPPGSSWAGAGGVVVRDTKTAFQLVTPADRLLLVPKAPCVFEYDVGRRRVVTLLGRGLVEQPAPGRRARPRR